MSDAIRFAPYEVAGSREWMMQCGARSFPQVVILLPFFHESNRLRGLAAQMMRALARQGIGSTLPDLPGCGESVAALPASLDDWHAAARAAAGIAGARAAVAMRSGALLDTIVPADRRWRLSPATGASLTRDLVRSRAVEAREDGRDEGVDTITVRARAATTRLAGYLIPSGLFTSLEAAHPHQHAARTVRLVGDDRPADARVAGPLLWRQSEPSIDPDFVQALTDDFIAWAATCAGF